MSLAILPSSAPMAYNQSSGPTLLAPSPSPAKRPKLSLNTTNVPSVFGKGSTSLRLDTLSATSPTTRNTFRNAYDPTQSRQAVTSRPPKPRLAPLATNVSISDKQTSLVEESNDSAASSASTLSTLSSVDFSIAEVPYRVAYNVKSILVNSPIARQPTRITSFAQSKPMFPTAKKVAFKAPLTEDIQTTKYTLRHSDIESSTSTISTLELNPLEKATAMNDEEKSDKAEAPVEVQKKEPSSPHTGDKRESSDDEDDGDSCPATPVAGRKKRHREWRWTLGPIDQPCNDKQSPQEQPSEETDHIDQHSSGV